MKIGKRYLSIFLDRHFASYSCNDVKFYICISAMNPMYIDIPPHVREKWFPSLKLIYYKTQAIISRKKVETFSQLCP